MDSAHVVVIAFAFILCLTDVRIKLPAVRAMTTINSVCPKCGTIAKSGKSSCCGRGGSWFKNCGGTGSASLHHTWYEGIHACNARTQSRIVVGQQAENSKTIFGVSMTITPMSVNMSTPTSNIPTDSTSVSTQRCIALHTSLLITIVIMILI